MSRKWYRPSRSHVWYRLRGIQRPREVYDVLFSEWVYFLDFGLVTLADHLIEEIL